MRAIISLHFFFLGTSSSVKLLPLCPNQWHVYQNFDSKWAFSTCLPDIFWTSNCHLIFDISFSDAHNAPYKASSSSNFHLPIIFSLTSISNLSLLFPTSAQFILFDHAHCSAKPTLSFLTATILILLELYIQLSIVVSMTPVCLSVFYALASPML